jgi:hypothetical protein
MRMSMNTMHLCMVYTRKRGAIRSSSADVRRARAVPEAHCSSVSSGTLRCRLTTTNPSVPWRQEQVERLLVSHTPLGRHGVSHWSAGAYRYRFHAPAASTPSWIAAAGRACSLARSGPGPPCRRDKAQSGGTKLGVRAGFW